MPSPWGDQRGDTDDSVLGVSAIGTRSTTSQTHTDELVQLQKLTQKDSQKSTSRSSSLGTIAFLVVMFSTTPA